MSRPRRFHLVLGTGGLGRAVMRRLVEAGAAVRMAGSDEPEGIPGGVELFAADPADADASRGLGVGARAVYACFEVPRERRPELLPPRVEAAIAVATDADGPLVYPDDLLVYGPAERPLGEELPSRPQGPEGRTRARLADRVLQAHADGTIRAVIGRAADLFGPGVRHSAVGERIFADALDGRTARVPGNPDMPHTFTYVDDCAGALVQLARRESAWGEVWHVPAAEAVTTRQFLRMIYQQAGRTPRIKATSPWMARLKGWLRPGTPELQELAYRWDRPFVVDARKFAAAFGTSTTPHRRAVAETLDWCRRVRRRARRESEEHQEREATPA